MKSNPFLEFGAFPRFASIGPPQVTDAINTLIGAVQDTVTQVSADAAPPTWETVCAPVEAALEALIRAWNQVEHLHSVIGTEDWRTVYEGNLPHIATLFAQLGQHEGLHRRLCALRDDAHFAELSATRKKIVLDNIDDLERSGVSLPEDKKAAFQSNSEQLSLLGATFEKNLVQATDAHSLTVEDESVLSDMPADLRDIARQSAEEANTKGWRFTLQQPSFIAFIKYGKDRKLREKMHRAYFTRASELDSDERNNRPVIEKIIDLRRQQAKLLGNKTFSALTLERRMAETPDQAIEFLRDLLHRALPHARRELAELREFAATELGIDDLQQWDAPYASEQLRQRRYHFSEAELRPYLQQERVLSGLFQCVHQLFGVRLKPATAEVWHEDVRHYQVLDREENPIGGLYLDPYAREKKTRRRLDGRRPVALPSSRRHTTAALGACHLQLRQTRHRRGADGLERSRNPLPRIRPHPPPPAHRSRRILRLRHQRRRMGRRGVTQPMAGKFRLGLDNHRTDDRAHRPRRPDAKITI